jgi:hypothetical protein
VTKVFLTSAVTTTTETTAELQQQTDEDKTASQIALKAINKNLSVTSSSRSHRHKSTLLKEKFHPKKIPRKTKTAILRKVITSKATLTTLVKKFPQCDASEIDKLLNTSLKINPLSFIDKLLLTILCDERKKQWKKFGEILGRKDGNNIRKYFNALEKKVSKKEGKPPKKVHDLNHKIIKHLVSDCLLDKNTSYSNPYETLQNLHQTYNRYIKEIKYPENILLFFHQVLNYQQHLLNICKTPPKNLPPITLPNHYINEDDSSSDGFEEIAFDPTVHPPSSMLHDTDINIEDIMPDVFKGIAFYHTGFFS